MAAKTKKLWKWTWQKEGNNVGFLRICGKIEITIDPKYSEDYVDLHLTAGELRQLARDLTELTDSWSPAYTGAHHAETCLSIEEQQEVLGIRGEGVNAAVPAPIPWPVRRIPS
jgi:hypothetical protein